MSFNINSFINNAFFREKQDFSVPDKDLKIASSQHADLGNVEVEAGSTPWIGRLVSWVKQGAAFFSKSAAKENEAEHVNNRIIKEAVSTALEGILGNKAEAREIVNTIIGPRYDGTKAITTRQVQQIVQKAKEKSPSVIQSWRGAQRYLNELNADSTKPKIPLAIEKHFFEEVRLCLNGKKALELTDFETIMISAKKSYENEEMTKLEEAFPDLSSELKVTGSTSGSLDDLKNRVDTLSEATPELKQTLKEGIDHIKSALSLRAEVHFNPTKVIDLYYQLETNKAELQNCQKELNSLPPEGSELSKEVASLKEALTKELSTQDARLAIKMGSLATYITSDPFSAKNMLYPGRINAEAAKQMAKGIIKDLDTRIDALATKANSNTEDQEQLKSLVLAKGSLLEKITEWHATEVDVYNKAPNERLESSQPPHLLKADAALKKLKEFCKSSGIPAEITASLSKKGMKAAINKVMNEELDWNTTSRTMEASLGGVTRSYQQTSTPLSEGSTAVAAAMKKAKVKGIVPASRNEANQGFAINARMTKLEKRDDKGNLTLIHERQQHGIIDHFGIKDAAKRSEANRNSAAQLIQHGIETDPNFVQRALDNKAKGSTVANEVFYINTNLTTPTYTHREMPGKAESHNEYRYSINQGIAFNEAIKGTSSYTVHNASGEPQDIESDVQFIDFRFPVNYALDNSLDPGLTQAWKDLKSHNAGEFKKLFGELNVKEPITGVIGGVYGKLKEKAAEGDSKAKALVADMEEQCLYLRSMFHDEDYKTANGDRFKMPRHIDLLNNIFRQGAELLNGDGMNVRVVNAGGCMSGKDREGIANAAGQGAAMIKDLGGVVAPGHNNTEEERKILNTATVGVVDNTLQVTGFGGSKNAKEMASEIIDKDAIFYSAGLSKNAKT